MYVHPLMRHEVARARDEERLVRSLAAYRAMRAQEEQSPQAAVAGMSKDRLRILDRLRRRWIGTARTTTGPAV